jgi:hypothetical protein
MALSPFAVKSLLRKIMSDYDDCPCLPSQFKLFHTKSDQHETYACEADRGASVKATL